MIIYLQTFLLDSKCRNLCQKQVNDEGNRSRKIAPTVDQVEDEEEVLQTEGVRFSAESFPTTRSGRRILMTRRLQELELLAKPASFDTIIDHLTVVLAHVDDKSMNELCKFVAFRESLADGDTMSMQRCYRPHQDALLLDLPSVTTAIIPPIEYQSRPNLTVHQSIPIS